MPKYVLSRLGEALIAIWGLLTLVFVAARLTGDPAVLMLPLGATDADLAEFRHALGLDLPLWEQYAIFLADAVRGNFGESLLHQRPAMDVVLERFPATIQLSLVALVMGMVIGVIAGFVAALKRGTFLELIAMTTALLGQATPIFWLGIILILVFAVQLGWLPAGGRGTLAHLVLPAITLATFTSASIARLLRSSMIEILKEDYIRTAWAKGLVSHLVFMRHVARNALIPVVTMLGILAGELFSGAVVTETIFSWPGVGRVILLAIQSKDFPVVQAGVAVISAMFILINLLVDLTYGLLDPRIRINR
ncbi:MAG: ABC transporter permease [Rhodospirillales bacterium]|jgi:peptide/nickel transport system permease protein|nr:ABC transporter permease [Rhodospirillales bacterium]